MMQKNYIKSGKKILIQSICLVLLAELSPYQSIAFGQIVPDATLPVNSVVNSTDGFHSIEGGTAVVNNLFHSFKAFSIPSGQTAYFHQFLNTNHIFVRVTGSSISNINGLLQSGQANLFFLNPNGIIFGPNSSINIGGSFFATTAPNITFADGNIFSTILPERSVLSASLPSGLIFFGDSGKIEVLGKGHGVVESVLLSPFVIEERGGLKSSPNQTIALLGSEINFQGGIVESQLGNIEIASIAKGFVSFTKGVNGYQFNYAGIENFSDINIGDFSLIHIFDSPKGNISLSGKDINIFNGGFVLSRNVSNLPASNIFVKATGNVNIVGYTFTPTEPFRVGRSNITTERVISGESGSIFISANNLTVSEGGIIGIRAFNQAIGGNIMIDVNESVNVLGFSPSDPLIYSGIVNTTGGAGSSGITSINARNLLVNNGGAIAVSNLGTNNAGTLHLKIKETIEITGGVEEFFLPSALSTTTYRTGNGGNLIIDTKRLILRDGGRVDTSSLAFGNAGNLAINASESIEISGKIPNSINASAIGSLISISDPAFRAIWQLPALPLGNSGSVTINTPSLTISNSAFISARNDGVGDAGNLILNVNKLEMRQSEVSASTRTGQGGNIFINANEINLLGGAKITAGVGVLGTGGNIRINANTLFLEDSAIIAATESGHGGNLFFDSSNIQLLNGQISATAGGLGNGGNIDLNSDRLLVLDQSSLTAQAFAGMGGDIDINSRVALISPDSLISASSQLGIDGEVTIDAEILDLRDLTLSTLQFTDPSLLANSCFNGDRSNLARLTISGPGGLPDQTISPYELSLPGTRVPQPQYIRLPPGKRLATSLEKTETGWRLVGSAGAVPPDSIPSCG